MSLTIPPEANDPGGSTNTNSPRSETGHGGKVGSTQRTARPGQSQLLVLAVVDVLTAWQVTKERGFEILDEKKLKEIIEVM
jgi:hypothetical protein